ncbi:protein phosphatase 2C-like domain-containing protein 1 isoform X2 [Hyperolius riggenbachi]
MVRRWWYKVGSWLTESFTQPRMKRSKLSTIAETSYAGVQNVYYKQGQKCSAEELRFTCHKCKERFSDYVDYIMHDHEHRYEALLGFKPHFKPADLPRIVIEKEPKMTGMKSSSDQPQRGFQKATYSYEIIKDQQETSNTTRSSITSDAICHVYSTDLNKDLIKSIVVCSHRNDNWQSDMEDSFAVINGYGQRENTCFIGIFDGFHGKSAANTASQELPIWFLDNLSKNDPSYTMTEEEKAFVSSLDTVFTEDYKEAEDNFSSHKRRKYKDAHMEGINVAYAKAFWRTDRTLKLGRQESSKSRWSGCTAVTCLLDGLVSDKTQSSDTSTQTHKRRLGMMHIANVGDLKAVLCQYGKSHCLTRDHSTASSHEMRRVVESGGSVSANEDCGLIEGVSKVTRGLGFHGDPKLKTSVIPVPRTISIPIHETSQFLILASSGLWEVFSECEVVDMVQDLLASMFSSPSLKRKNQTVSSNQNSFHAKGIYREAASHVSQELVKAAISVGSQQNITVCLVLLPGCDKA